MAEAAEAKNCWEFMDCLPSVREGYPAYTFKCGDRC